jgi:hypothetical protein
MKKHLRTAAETKISTLLTLGDRYEVNQILSATGTGWRAAGASMSDLQDINTRLDYALSLWNR